MNFKVRQKIAPSEDRTHDLQITQDLISDYETDALPTALLRLNFT